MQCGVVGQIDTDDSGHIDTISGYLFSPLEKHLNIEEYIFFTKTYLYLIRVLGSLSLAYI